MCGIVAAVARRDVFPILLEGLKRLEYRGYDSAGIAIINSSGQIQRSRVLGKVAKLEQKHAETPLKGEIGIAHTRWATHGKPSLKNAHPHLCRAEIALVHNGIIENHALLRQQQEDVDFEFESETDTEVIVNAIYQQKTAQTDLLQAVFRAVEQLQGAYALGIISYAEPHRLIAVRQASPLVIGIGRNEYFIASDVFALLSVTQQFIFLEDGDIADIKYDQITIYDQARNIIERPINVSKLTRDVTDKGNYRHYMLKEIFSQPSAIARTLENRIQDGHVVATEFGKNAASIFVQIKAVKIVACGTSYHAGLIAAHWMEEIAHIPCYVEIASEYRYRKSVVLDGTLFISISQSGETADTLAALQLAKNLNYLSTLAICNVAESSLTREAALVFLTHAGQEISVASTKAFTTQLTSLFLLVLAIARHNGLNSDAEKKLVSQLKGLPNRSKQLLQFSCQIEMMARDFADKDHALFLGRSSFLAVAMEGALKLKEVSYIHAEAYAAGELKHGPLALVDNNMPIIAVAPNNHLLEKLKSNLQEVKARGGKLYLFADESSMIEDKKEEGVYVIKINQTCDFMAPVLYTIALQLLAYYIAVIKGVDVDQPRNLAKSVTVE